MINHRARRVGAVDGRLACACVVLAAMASHVARADKTDKSDESKIKVAVLALKTGDDASAQLAPTIVQLVSSKLDREGVFQVITEEDIKSMVSLDQMKTALSCDEQASCLGEIGAALGVPYAITGSLGQAGSTWVLSLVLIDVNKAKTIKRESVSYASVDEMMKSLDKHAERAVAELLYTQKGKLLVRCSEEGAVVELDGKALGTTPFAEQEVPSGPHRVTVSKEGFIQAAVDVAVRPREQSVVDAPLKPSPQFLVDYKARTGGTRAIAWGTGVGAGATALISAGGFAWAFARAAQFRSDGAPKDAAGNIQVPIDKLVEVNSAWFTGLGGILATAGLAGTSAWLFATGDDPARYDAAGTPVGSGE